MTCPEENGTRHFIAAVARTHYRNSLCKVWPINLTSSWKTTRRSGGKKNQHLLCLLWPLLHLRTIRWHTISCNARLWGDAKNRERKWRKLWEMDGEGGFCCHISHAGYRKRPDAVCQSKPEITLRYFPNEEVERSGQGGKWSKTVTMPNPKEVIP